MNEIRNKLFIIIFIVCFQITAANAASYDSVVTGKGNPRTDVTAVQLALDNGSSVLLKGTFDFGKDGSVTITKDISIHGEIDAHGSPVTKILGGLWSFHSSLPSQLPPTEPGPKVAIYNIHFEGAFWAPVSLPYCAGADIRNNKITNVLPVDNKMPYFGKDGIHRQQGIIFYPPYTLPNEYGKYQPGLVAGNIIVSDNFIDLSNQIPQKTVAQGILVFGATGANIQILRNRVLNSSRNSVEVIDNYPGPNGEGMTIIKGNKIITAENGISLPSPSTPNGIVAGWFLNLSGASDPALRNKIIVTGNQIETRGVTSIGIIVISDGATIVSNTISLNGGKKAKGILHFNSHATITHNRIEGSGMAGVLLTPWKAFKGDQNTLVNNDFSKLYASGANLIIRSLNNIVVGDCGKIVDHSKTNLVF